MLLVKQETQWDCMLACLAALIEVPLQRVREAATELGIDPEQTSIDKPYHGINQFELQAIASHLGYAMPSQPFNMAVVNEQNEIIYEAPNRWAKQILDTDQYPRILVAASKEDGHRHAWAISEDGEVMNPKYGMKTTLPRLGHWEYIQIMTIHRIH